MPYSPEEREALHEQQMVFNKAYAIMAERTGAYSLTWQQYGALANLLNSARKIDRLMSIWWRGDDDEVPVLDKSLLDDAYDAINYIGFFIQEAEKGNLTGTVPVRPDLKVLRNDKQHQSFCKLGSVHSGACLDEQGRTLTQREKKGYQRG
jgi:hypothetical protein